MAKTKSLFICSNCDAQYEKWSGRCFECGKWGTVEEQATDKRKEARAASVAAQPAAALTKLSDAKAAAQERFSSGDKEVDHVLGGGIVPGSFLLLGGEPGIGKSTLSLQLAGLVDNVLYFSGEESVGQISDRAKRAGIASASLQLSNEIACESIISTIKKHQPAVAIIDSIQTIYSTDVDGEPGNQQQVRACATKLLEAAKSGSTAVIIIGHVTKEGNVAGPRLLEHLVDTVLYLEGDRHHQFRVLRAVKNRFGSTNNIGLFEMKETGLSAVENPSEALLAERQADISGSVITCLIEGNRPILVEIQALVNKTTFGYPVRKANGFDSNRLHMLIAVLQRRANIDLSQYDVHVNVVGGIKANEPAADLAVATAIASAYKDKPLGGKMAVFGEVGLGGEVRRVSQLEKRLEECTKFGVTSIITKPTKKKQDVIHAVSHVSEIFK